MVKVQGFGGRYESYVKFHLLLYYELQPMQSGNKPFVSATSEADFIPAKTGIFFENFVL